MAASQSQARCNPTGTRRDMHMMHTPAPYMRKWHITNISCLSVNLYIIVFIEMITRRCDSSTLQTPNTINQTKFNDAHRRILLGIEDFLSDGFAPTDSISSVVLLRMLPFLYKRSITSATSNTGNSRARSTVNCSHQFTTKIFVKWRIPMAEYK